MRKPIERVFSILLFLVMLLSMLTVSVSAVDLIGRNTISSVAITVDRPIAGEPLANCVPETTLCDITCTWSTRGLKGETEVPASTLAQAGTVYNLTMVLTPRLDLYTFADSVTGTVNGTSVTVERMSSTQAACMARLTPVTRETEVAVSLPQPVINTTPGTPTVAGGHTVSEYAWYKSTSDDFATATKLTSVNEAFNGSFNYWMRATVTAGTNSLFDESTTVTVNGEAVVILERDANTISFYYYVSHEDIPTELVNIYVANGSGGYWSLTDGDTKTNGNGYAASYEDGVLTLTNTGDSAISGSCKIPNLAGYTAIYAGSDLTVHFNGDFNFDLSGTPDTAAYVYGIYVDGDLTLVNVSDDDCTVSFTPADGVLATHSSSGIYCGANLSVQNAGGGSFVLNAHGVGVQLVDGAVVANFTNNGIYAAGSIAIGNDCTVNATAADVALSAEGTTTSRGIYAYRGLTIGKNAVVTATGGDINPSRSAETLNIGFSQLCCGVEVRGGNITVNGGTLTATGGNIDYGDLTGSSNATYGEQNSYGIYAADITLSGGDITATAGICRSSAYVTGSLSEGIFCSNLTVSSGTLTAAADDAWWESTGLRVQNNLNQTGGTIIGTGDLAVCSGGSGTGSSGIYVVGTLTASGGSLTGRGGTMGIQRPSVGLWATTIALSGKADVTGIGGLATTGTIETPLTGSSTFVAYPGNSVGVQTYNNLTVDGSAVLTATGGTVKGDRTSSAEAMSIGLNFIATEGITISGSGTVIATGGETHYGGKSNNYWTEAAASTEMYRL